MDHNIDISGTRQVILAMKLAAEKIARGVTFAFYCNLITITFFNTAQEINFATFKNQADNMSKLRQVNCRQN